MELSFVNVYVDDIIIFSSSLEDHLNHLRQVVSKLLEAGLKLKPSKCHFARAEVEYLGFQVTPKGLEPTKLLVRAVEEFPVTTSLKELQRFWGWLPIIGDSSLSLPKWLIRYITLHVRMFPSTGILSAKPLLTN